jgi:hypothetical protein
LFELLPIRKFCVTKNERERKKKTRSQLAKRPSPHVITAHILPLALHLYKSNADYAHTQSYGAAMEI